MALERHGIPSATIVTHSFAEYGRRLTRLQKMPDLPLVIIRHPVAAKPEDQVRADISSQYREVVRSLVRE
jgi:hypothetical protein